MSASRTGARAHLPAIVVAPVAGSALVRDYLAGDRRAAAFYTGHPADPAGYRRKASEVAQRLGAGERIRVGEAIRPLSRAAAARLELVLSGQGYFVTTGQQTGLFTGPLYTIYKALAAIRLAGALEELLERPVQALFWSAADDHDWEEVSHATILDGAGYPRRVALAGHEQEAPLAMSHRRLGREAELAIDELRSLLPATMHRDRLVPSLRSAHAPGRTMAEAFEDTLAEVLAGLDIALVSSAHPLVKLHSVPVIADALARAAQEEALVSAQTRRLVEAGYHGQVAVAAGTSNVFFQDEHGRDRLVLEGGTWRLRRSRRRLEPAELRARLHAEPAAFSPNVLLRPVVESALFPTLAYVGGPAEVAYFAQIGCLFRAHGIVAPVVFPRPGVTLVESGPARALDRFGLDLPQLQQPIAELEAQVVRREMPAALTDSLRRLREQVAAGFDALGEAVGEAAPGMARPLAGARRQALAQATAMEKRIMQHVRREQAVRFEQLRRAAAALYPGESAQERVLNVLPFLTRYGPELLEAILAALPADLGESHSVFGGVACDDAPLAPASLGGIA